jgi:uncharacterized protein YidB (DUF937 family)
MSPFGMTLVSHRGAKVRPEVVDQATPQGEMPKQDPFNKGIDHLKKMFKSGS